MQNSQLHRRAIFWMVVTTILWGGSFVFNKIGLREINPLAFLSLRFLLATAIMLVICIPRLPRLDETVLFRGAVVGVALGCANLTFVYGIRETTISRAGFLCNLFVLLVPVICYLFWREKISGNVLAGVAVSVGGLWLLAKGGIEGFSRGDLLCTVCALFIALHIISVSKMIKNEDVYLLSLVQFAVAGAGGTIVFLATSQPFGTFSIPSVSALVYCAIFPTVICFTLQNTWQRYTTPSQAGLIYTLDPLWSMLGGYLFLGERLTGVEWLGCGLLFAGVLLPLLLTRLKELTARNA